MISLWGFPPDSRRSGCAQCQGICHFCPSWQRGWHPSRGPGARPSAPKTGPWELFPVQTRTPWSSGEWRRRGKEEGHLESNFGSSPGPHLGWFGCRSVGSLGDEPDNLRARQPGLWGCRSLRVVLLHLPAPWSPEEPCGEEAGPLLSGTLASYLGETAEWPLAVLDSTSAAGVLMPVPEWAGCAQTPLGIPVDASGRRAAKRP